MSQIGKKLIKIPNNIIIKIKKKNKNYKIVNLKNKLKEIELKISNLIKISFVKNCKYIMLEGLKKKLYGKENKKYIKKIWGLSRSLISNNIKGLSQGFRKKLILIGMGYKANIDNNNLILKLGYSHLIKFNIPEDIKISVKKSIIITIEGENKNLVTSTAAIIKSFKKPEPYNGKGIRYINEKIKIKERSN